MSLHDYGWNAFFSESFESLKDSRLEPGRVISSGGGICRVACAAGERSVSLAGRLKHMAASAADLPVAGDWVAFRAGDGGGGAVEHVLARRSCLSRKVAGGRSREQVIAANVETIFVVMGLDGDFNLRRLERYLTLAWESGARPAVLLNKADVCPGADARLEESSAVAAGVPVLLLSSLRGSGVEEVRSLLPPAETAVLVGSSGAGKSTLINRLLGRDAQATREVRDDDSRGRHTTTRRELFRLPGGALLIDNPGIREVQLWAGEESLARTFEEVEEVAARCRYRDCGHGGEPGCAVRAAVESGELPEERLESWLKLRREIRYLETRVDPAARKERQRRWKVIHKEQRRVYKKRGRGD